MSSEKPFKGTAYDFPSSGDKPSGMSAKEVRSRMGLLSRRIREKIEDYDRYRFSRHQSRALNIFFDLAQEYTDKFDLWALSVLIPRTFFGRETVLYMLNEESEFEFICSSSGPCMQKAGVPEVPPVVSGPEYIGDMLYIPIKGNHELIALLPFKPEKDIIGILGINVDGRLGQHEELFFFKYANRIGFRIHNRIVAQKNREHLQFIKTLVQDIGHNVIVPNMYFKLYYRRLEVRIRKLKDLSERFVKFTRDCTLNPEEEGSCRQLQQDLDSSFSNLVEQYNEIFRHYEQTSLFLETLLRRSHFEKGRYVLELRPCEIANKLIGSQIDRYRTRLEEKGIGVRVEGPGVVGEKELYALADLGLASQVIANLVSNAVKYTGPPPGEEGGRKELVVRWGCLPEGLPDGRDAVRISAFTTGDPVAPEDVPHLYSEGFRGSNAEGEYGTGHGLSFMREVVYLHGGEVGYVPHDNGNEFYFTLPCRSGEGVEEE